jgi:ATP-dependent RNA helicase DDX24/MAK5
MSWESLIDDPALISALKSNNMPVPTEIQFRSLPHSLKYRQDLIISSKTGSGKTLCFGIPILHHSSKSETLQTLIISPTRELCLQIESHLKAINFKNLTILTLIGGISHEKQERLLKRKPEVLIGTPGRLWEFIKDRQNDYVRSISSIKFLVIDEADRMIQLGHFRELRLLLKYIQNPELVPKEEAHLEEHDGIVDLNFALEIQENEKKVLNKRQTFVISATMTIDKSTRKAFSGKLGRFKDEGEDIMEKLHSVISFRHKPKLIDLTTDSKLPEGLEEFIVLCSDDQKNSLLHYTLSLYQGTKAIIFTNTISTSRKLVQFLKYLDFKVSKLDGKMQQRDRLKKLDK